MKRITLYLFILTNLTFLQISGQDTTQKLRKNWLASVSYSPISTFYYYGRSSEKSYDLYTEGIREVIYPIGINFRLARNINDQLSLTSGINIKVRMTNDLIDIMYEYSGSYYEKSTDDRYILEIPIGLLYNIKSDSKLFDPYLKTGIRNSYFKRYYDGEYKRGSLSGMETGEINNHDGRYIMFYELGAGTFIKLSKPLILMIESNVTYTFSGLGYVELLAGFTYSFK
jgi:hypothetical protein